MCVIFFYVNSNPEQGGYKLILASNRDEFYARDTKQSDKWHDAEHVYGGIDLEPGREGGTWLAVSGNEGIFKVGALLNLTGEPRPRNAHVVDLNHIQHYNDKNPHTHHSIQLITPLANGCAKSYNTSNTPTSAEMSSAIIDQLTSNLNTTQHDHHQHLQLHNNNSLLGRGMIVSDYVRNYTEEYNNENYNRQLVEDCKKYSAFNFVSIEIGSSSSPASVTLCSNVPASLVHYKENTCYGFGNSLPSAPFEKVRCGRNRFEKLVAELQTNPALQQHDLIDNLFDLLKCKEKFWPDVELKRRAPNWGEHLSAINVYVPNEGYGSRTHTVVLVDAENKMHFIEETMLSLDPQGAWSRNHIVKQYCQ